MRTRIARGRDGGVFYVHSALSRASAARAGGRQRAIFGKVHFASAMHVCVGAKLLVRVPVHGVGESDRPSQVYSDMKYIFCEYLRLFAAREERTVARARARRPRSLIYGGPSLYRRHWP